MRIPKVIAKITLCGAFVMEINEGMNWNPPTPEQIKNLKEILNIDVKLIGEDDDEDYSCDVFSIVTEIDMNM